MNSGPKLQVAAGHLAGLDCAIVSPTSSQAKPQLCVVLCHGFGAPGTDLVALASDLASLCREQIDSIVYIFPQAPLDLEDYGIPGGRAWWMIDIERFQRAMGRPEELARLRTEIPAGMPESSELLRGLVTEVQRQFGIPTSRILLGGFSQGSMVATDVALRLPDRPAGLCIFSGTLLAEAQWTSLAQKRGPLPILQSHGRFDPILPFAGAEALRDVLTEAGLEVEFLPFAGPHTIPYPALERLASLMQRICGERAAS